MGSYTSLKIAGYEFLYSKSDVVDEAMTIFRESDRKIAQRPSADDEEFLYDAVEYSSTAGAVIDRLEVMGFTLGLARRTYDAWREHELDDSEEAAEKWWKEEEREIIRVMTFDVYKENLSTIVHRNLRAYPSDDREQPELTPEIKYILAQHLDDAELAFRGDVRLLIRIICEVVHRGSEVIQDLTELVAGGYFGEDEPICLTAIARLTSEHPAVAPVIVLTEGASDGRIIEAAVTVLYPHLRDYYSFLDFEASRAPGGASSLVAIVKAFAGAGITNRVVALFDNDTAASEALRALQSVRLPRNLAVLRYPNLDFLRKYPTVGPTGLQKVDVNGLAASVELYLGADVLLDNGLLEPVRWRGYSDALQQYQGEVGNKVRLIERYFDRVTRCRADAAAIDRNQWSGLNAILQGIFHAFDDRS